MAVVGGRTTPVDVGNHLNQAPAAEADSYVTDEDVTVAPTAEMGVLANDTDLENDALTAVLVQGPAHAAAFELNADGSFAYTPVPNFNGTDSFTYRARDAENALSDPITVILTVRAVNDAPVLAPIGTGSVVEDEGDLVEFTAVATDVDGPVLRYSLVGTVPVGAAIDPITGQFTWTPNDAQGFAHHAIEVQVSDGDATNAQTDVESLLVTVNEVIEGTAARDTILVVQAGGTIVARVNGQSERFVDVPKVTMRGFDGDDLITVRGLTIPTVIESGAGDDRVDGRRVT